MAPGDLLFVPLVLIPCEVLWKGQTVEHIDVGEAVSDDNGDLEMTDPPVVNTSLVVGSIFPSDASG